MKFLVLLPMKPNAHPQMEAIAAHLLDHLVCYTQNEGHVVESVIDRRGVGDVGLKTLDARTKHMAPLRQQMIDDHFVDHDGVFWVDADIIQYPAYTLSHLIEMGGIAAPMIVKEGDPDRFYDVAGFVQEGQWANLYRPWFLNNDPVIELDGVGSTYYVPAEVYRTGGRYFHTPGYTEHFSICLHARKIGVSVKARTDLVVYHADLEKHGWEPEHQG